MARRPLAPRPLRWLLAAAGLGLAATAAADPLSPPAAATAVSAPAEATGAAAIAPEVEVPPRQGPGHRWYDGGYAHHGAEHHGAAADHGDGRPGSDDGDCACDGDAAATPAHGWQWQGWLRQRAVADGVSPVEAMGPAASEILRLTPPLEVEFRTRVGGSAVWSAPSGFVRKLDARLEGELRVWDRPDPALRDGPWLLRRGGVELTTLAGQFTLGRTLSTWGLGLLAQDGTDDPLQFGVRRGGNVVTRLGWGFLPAALWHTGDPLQAFPLAIALAYDWVARDDVAFFPGDSARNAIAAVLYRGTALQAGVYGVLRDQRDAQGLQLDARIVDGYVKYRRDGGHHRYLEVAAEGAWTQGRTGWLKTVQQVQGVDIAQWGGVARIETGNRRAVFRLEGGLASADGRPLDGTLRNQRFNSDYRVGLVMFPQAQRILSEQTAANLGDPRYVQSAPAGIERLRTEGAVTQALYLHQVTRLQPMRHLAVLVGGTVAHSPTAVADPFRTWLAGGVPTGPRGGRGARDLGFELDAGVELSHRLGRWLHGALAIQGGFWVPGKAFDDATGQRMAAVAAWQATVHVQAGL